MGGECPMGVATKIKEKCSRLSTKRFLPQNYSDVSKRTPLNDVCSQCYRAAKCQGELNVVCINSYHKFRESVCILTVKLRAAP